MKADGEARVKPIQDQYFLRRLDLSSGQGAIDFVAQAEFGKRRCGDGIAPVKADKLKNPSSKLEGSVSGPEQF